MRGNLDRIKVKLTYGLFKREKIKLEEIKRINSRVKCGAEGWKKTNCYPTEGIRVYFVK